VKYVLLSLIAVSTLASSPARAEEPSVDACPGSYVIGQEDVLDIAVWDNTELTRTVPVRPDGKISLPLLNDVAAAGLTPMQLRDVLAKALTEYIPRPAVSVLVKEIHSVKVSVIGEVKTPGRYELKDRATVLDMLALAGGLTEFAARNRIAVLRQEAGGTRRIPFPYDKATKKNTGSNICLHPGDVIFIP